jgi:hypothetical protein
MYFRLTAYFPPYELSESLRFVNLFSGLSLRLSFGTGEERRRRRRKRRGEVSETGPKTKIVDRLSAASGLCGN